MVVLFIWTSALGPLGVVARAQSPQSDPSQKPPAADPAALRTTYVLGPQDQVSLHVVDVPELSDKPQRIDSTGDLKLPMVGRVHVAGLTVEQLETEVTNRLKVFLLQPDVSVTVTEFRSQSVSILGAVGSPGIHQLETDKTLLEVLTKAGGASVDAGPIVRVSRRLDQGRIPLPEATDDAATGFSTVDIPLKPLLEATTPDKNIIIRPNDFLSVPRAELVYVIGEVGRVGPIPVTRGASVSIVEAISASGGMSRTAASSHARILRAIDGDQKRTEIPVDVKKIMQGRSNDVPLYAGDILVVPDSGSKRATTRAIEIAIQLGVMVGSYGLIR
ncbi:MAG: polysaccharide biosynthesis/export family protein [Acidobacteriota bacterium]